MFFIDGNRNKELFATFKSPKHNFMKTILYDNKVSLIVTGFVSKRNVKF